MTHDRESGLYCFPLKGMLFCSARQFNYQRILLNTSGLNLVFVRSGLFQFCPSFSGVTFLGFSWISEVLDHACFSTVAILNCNVSQPCKTFDFHLSDLWQVLFVKPQRVSPCAYLAKDSHEIPMQSSGPFLRPTFFSSSYWRASALTSDLCRSSAILLCAIWASFPLPRS